MVINKKYVLHWNNWVEDLIWENNSKIKDWSIFKLELADTVISSIKNIGFETTLYECKGDGTEKQKVRARVVVR